MTHVVHVPNLVWTMFQCNKKVKRMAQPPTQHHNHRDQSKLKNMLPTRQIYISGNSVYECNIQQPYKTVFYEGLDALVYLFRFMNFFL